MSIAKDVDGPDLGKVALVNLEYHIDAILIELHDFRLDPRREPALAPIEFEDSIDVRADGAAREDLPRRELNFGRDLVVLKTLVALQDDAVDHWILANCNHQSAGIAAVDRHVGEELRRVEVLEGLVERLGRIGLPGREICVGSDRFRLEPLVTANRYRVNDTLGRSWSRGRRIGGRLRRGWDGRGRLGSDHRYGGSAEHRTDQKQRTGAPAKTLRP